LADVEPTALEDEVRASEPKPSTRKLTRMENRPGLHFKEVVVGVTRIPCLNQKQELGWKPQLDIMEWTQDQDN
jgi:hypothetical protein